MKFIDRYRIRKLVKNQEVYKIYNTQLKLFSNGGNKPKFDETGKNYYRYSDIRRHLAQIETKYQNCVVVRLNQRCKIIDDIEL